MKNIFFHIFSVSSLVFATPAYANHGITKSDVEPSVAWVDQFIMSKSWTGSKLPVGGISGLFFVPSSGKLFGVSDDKASPRIYEFSFSLKSPIRFAITKEIVFKQKDHSDFAEQTLDLESIVFLKSGQFLVSSEGSSLRKLPPQIFIFSADGVLQKELIFPNAFIGDKKGHGIFPNKGPESLTISSDESLLYAGIEGAIRQDSIKVGGRGVARLIEWKFSSKDLTASESAQYAYVLEKTPSGHDMADPAQQTSLTELKNIGPQKFIAMERAWTPPQTVTVNLFNVDCSRASNIKDKVALAREDFVPCTKTLLTSINEFQNKIKPHIDNLEGLAIIDENIVIAADDNFSDKEINQFLVLHVLKNEKKSEKKK